MTRKSSASKPPAKRGRPGHEPTDDQRQLVRDLVVAGLNAEDIADKIGISRRSLYRGFSAELADAKCDLKVQTISQLRTAAADGNVAAMKQLLLLCAPKGLAAEVAAGKPLGKKAQAAIDCLTAGENSEWCIKNADGTTTNLLQPPDSATTRLPEDFDRPNVEDPKYKN